jgi:hypothetical protein
MGFSGSGPSPGYHTPAAMGTFQAGDSCLAGFSLAVTAIPAKVMTRENTIKKIRIYFMVSFSFPAKIVS